MADYIDAGILEQFERETGVPIDHQIYEEGDEVSSRLRSQPGCADIVIVDSFNITSLRELRLLSPLRKDLLPLLKNADPRYLDLSCDRGNDFSLPYHWGTTLIAYRRDQIPNPAHSWKLLWDPTLRGRVMMLNDSFEPMAAAMLLNQLNPQAPGEAGYARASAILLDQLDTMLASYGTDDQVKSALASGTVAAAMCYSGDAAFVAAGEPNVDFFIPEEGAMIWVDCLAIARDCRDSVLAHRFLNFFLRPEVAAQNANAIRYASTNRAAEPLIDPALKADPRICPPPDLREKLQLVPNLDAEHSAAACRHWHKVRSRFPVSGAPVKEGEAVRMTP